MTKFLTKAALAAAAATALLAAPATAASDDATFTATAKIVKPLTLTNLTALDFGTIVMNPSLDSETVTVSASGGPAVCGSGKLTCSGGSPADFTLTGVALQGVEMSYDSPPTVLTLVDGTATVDFSLDAAPSVTLDPDGEGTFSIGGQITVVAATLDGVYEADVNVVANYL